jgi:hypothetical protein
VGPRAGLDAVEKRKKESLSDPSRESNPIRLPLSLITKLTELPLLLCKNIKTEIHNISNLPVVLYSCETWSSALRQG